MPKFTARLKIIQYQMKIKGQLIIRTAQYQDFRPEVEIEVPDNLKNEELVKYLYKTYGNIAEKIQFNKVEKIAKLKNEFVEDLELPDEPININED